MMVKKKTKKIKEKSSAKPSKNEDKKILSDDANVESDLLQVEIDALQVSLEVAQQQLKEKDDKVLRAYAELENFKKRKEQEKSDFMKFSSEKLIVELLPIMDSFDMAANQAQQSDDPEFKAHVEGFLLIQKQLHGFLEKMNVTIIKAKDQPFNPTYHQAVMQESVDGVEPNTVIKVMQEGYALGDRVIRPAMVVVSN